MKEWSQAFYYISFQLIIQQKWVGSMIYHRASIAHLREKDKAFQLKQNLYMLAGVVILFISGAFVFLYKEKTQPNVPRKQTSICVALYAICMAMISLATVIMLLALCRMKKNMPKGHQSMHGFNLRSCIVYAMSYCLFLICYILFILNE